MESMGKSTDLGRVTFTMIHTCTCTYTLNQTKATTVTGYLVFTTMLSRPLVAQLMA